MHRSMHAPAPPYPSVLYTLVYIMSVEIHLIFKSQNTL